MVKAEPLVQVNRPTRLAAIGGAGMPAAAKTPPSSILLSATAPQAG